MEANKKGMPFEEFNKQIQDQLKDINGMAARAREMAEKLKGVTATNKKTMANGAEASLSFARAVIIEFKTKQDAEAFFKSLDTWPS